MANLVGTASRRVFESIVNICLDEKFDALLIVGDLFDGNLRSVKTAAFLNRQLRMLDDGGVRVFMIRGNHDAEAAAITNQLDLPPSVHVFSTQGETVRLDDQGVALHGVSFKKKAMPDSSLPKYQPAVPGLINIGLMHTSIGGSPPHDVYAPVSVSALAAHGYDYWALGHIHKRQVHHEAPFIVMPGIPQGRDVGEAGPKSVTIGTVDETGLHIEERFTSIAEFTSAEVDVTDLEEMEAVRRAIAEMVRASSDAAQSDNTVLRLTLVGATPLAWRIRRDREQRLADAREEADAVGTVWIENLLLRLTAPALGEATDDPIIELQSLMKNDVLADPGFRAEADAAVSILVDKLPPALRDRFGADETTRMRVLDRLLLDGSLDVAAALETISDSGSVV